MFDSVLMVCVGNICRSPMAEGLLRARLVVRGRGRVASAGLAALEGRGADPMAVELMAARGIDISTHRARQLTPELIAAADLVLVMEEGHRRQIETLAPSARGRVHRIGKFGKYDVADPFGKSREAFASALSLIERGLEDLERVFWRAA
jgi:protein-tyrosine phosphatase